MVSETKYAAHGLRMVLTPDPGLHVIAEAATGEEALQQIVSLSPDVAILDIDMPGRSGLAVVRELSRLNASVRIIILTLRKGMDPLLEALAIGIRGYVLKALRSPISPKAYGAWPAAIPTSDRACTRGCNRELQNSGFRRSSLA
jgi:DNA-binding NarL/FixJ family response regulator